MTFRVGQKVVCIEGIPASLLWNYPQTGQIYTIRGLTVAYDGDLCLRLVELKNRVGMSAVGRMECEPMFRRARFRPVVSRKTDISALKALLVPGAKIRETA